MKHTVAILAGDGIGPEVMHSAITVLQTLEKKYDLETSFHRVDLGLKIRNAVKQVIQNGYHTQDIQTNSTQKVVSLSETTTHICEHL